MCGVWSVEVWRVGCEVWECDEGVEDGGVKE